MNTLSSALSERVDEVIRAHQRQPFLSTMGRTAAIEELERRYAGLEEAVRQIALEVEKLASAHKS
jgi:hypothetical protein